MAPPLRTRFVCTLAPRPDLRELVAAFLDSGMAIARVNGAHGEIEGVQTFLREVQDLLAGRAQILLDLPGAKIRTNGLGAGLALEAGAEFSLSAAMLTIPEAIACFEAGQRISAADGTLELEVIAKERDAVRLKALNAGHLGDRKGLNIRGLGARLPLDQSRDVRLLEVARSERVDFVGLSFVRREEHVRRVRSWLLGSDVGIVAKIETAEAIASLDKILEVADMVMIDRGDLEADLGRAHVPLATREVLSRARQKGVPSIVASQFLLSMLKNPVPTAAEVSDLSHAISDGATHLMFSEETAIGEHPRAAVALAADVARATEAQEDHAYEVIILAAGASPGLGSLTSTRHKCMLDVGGMTIIAHQLEVLARAGIVSDRVRIVTGHGAQSLEAYLSGEGFRGQFVLNPWHATTHLWASTWLARPKGPTVILYGDILLHEGILLDVLNAPHAVALAVDFDSECSPEDEKVQVMGGIVTKASKDIPKEESQGEFIGLARLNAMAANALSRVLERGMREGRTMDFLTEAFVLLQAEGCPPHAISVRGRPWSDNDFLPDLERSRREVWPKLRDRSGEG